MFQMIFPASARYLSSKATPPTLRQKLEHQRNDRVDQRCCKYPLGSAIPVGVDINGEEGNIQHQTRNGDGRNLASVAADKSQEFAKSKSRIEFDEIVDYEAHDRRHEAQYQSESEIVFFEDHNFHVFSSLPLRT